MPDTVALGRPFAMVQNQVYALPAYPVTMFTDATTPTVQQSTTAAFTANVAVTLTGGQATLAGGFVRTTSASVTATFKQA